VTTDLVMYRIRSAVHPRSSPHDSAARIGYRLILGGAVGWDLILRINTPRNRFSTGLPGYIRAPSERPATGNLHHCEKLGPFCTKGPLVLRWCCGGATWLQPSIRLVRPERGLVGGPPR